MTELPTDFETFAKLGDNIASFPAIKPAVPERIVGDRRKFRPIWLSDVHLGTQCCNAGLPLHLPNHTHNPTLYLVS